MAVPFRPAPLADLARRVFGALDTGGDVLGIPQGNFQVPSARVASAAFGRPLAAPLGLAAGPHTQLAQNIAAGWLCGARFVELKTVQVLDELEVSRPCIDAADETYNCEWSQELRLGQSLEEYLSAWVLLHALAHRLGLPGPGAHFAMSVGYDLAGITSPSVQAFLSSMRDATAALPAAIDAVAAAYPAVRDVEIPACISNHVTLSTMHGCPPLEIERIALYLLRDLGVDTWVKLNPTLLGPERLRGLLNRDLGFAIEVPDAAFEHDPRFEDAMAMVKSLAHAAKEAGRAFGLKLSNTLEVVNRRPVFPSTEKTSYLSGRALHPLTLTLARLVDEELGGAVPVSFCGGADAESFPGLVADGLSPVTVCTDLLKPGGYARLQQYLVNLDDAMESAGAASLDDFVAKTSGGRGARWNLARHAEAVGKDGRYARRERPLAFKGPRPLGLFDCVAAPCQEACPAHQNIPDYLWLVAQGRPSEALEVILRTNPLPGITGSVCDHPCTERCVRIFYDAPLAIREVKRHAFEHGAAPEARAGAANGVKVAVVGAGPAGLTAASFLARMGFSPVVFEERDEAGGMVRGVIPAYRFDGRAIGGDLDRLRQLGVEIRLGQALGRDLSLWELRRDHRYVFLGVGAQRGKKLGIPGEEAGGVLDGLELLKRIRAGTVGDLGGRVLVVGGGNTAMDAARSARRLTGGEVSVVYRRTRAEMPAEPAELRDALEEGVVLRDLLAPVRIVTEGGRVVGLACTRMRLGEPDASGRPRPVPVEGSEEFLPADTVVAAVGQEALLDFFDGEAPALRRDGSLDVDAATGETSLPGVFAGGDVARGAATVVKAIADGRAVAEEIGRRHGVALPPEPDLDKGGGTAARMERKARTVAPLSVPLLPVARRGGFDEVILSFPPGEAEREAARCLDCDEVCSLCVTVCPNRANVAWTASPFSVTLPHLVARGGALVAEGEGTVTLAQGVQVANVGDFCNECGNCVAFCPTAGAPWRDKPRFWYDPEGFAESAGDAFRFSRPNGALVLEARLGGVLHRLEDRGSHLEYRTEKLVARFDPRTRAFLDAHPATPLAEGEPLDLTPAAPLLSLRGSSPRGSGLHSTLYGPEGREGPEASVAASRG